MTISDIEKRRAHASTVLRFEDARQFARATWHTEQPEAPPLQVNRQEVIDQARARSIFHPDGAAEARWAHPGGDRLGMPRTGELAGTVGPVPYIDTTDEALIQLTLLHEIAHLLVDTDQVLQGHNRVWAAAFGRLIGTYIDQFTRMDWEIHWEWALELAAARTAENDRPNHRANT